MLRKTCVTALAFLGVVVSGCSDTALAPFEPEITSATGTFELQATGVTNVTTTAQYSWECDGSPANVNQSTTASAGTATLRIDDADGATVYTRDLTENGSFQTVAGVLGTWTVHLTLSGFDGDLNFRVESP